MTEDEILAGVRTCFRDAVDVAGAFGRLKVGLLRAASAEVRRRLGPTEGIVYELEAPLMSEKEQTGTLASSAKGDTR